MIEITVPYNEEDISMEYEIMGYVEGIHSSDETQSIVTYNSIRNRIEEIGYLSKIMQTDPIYHYSNINFLLKSGDVYDYFILFLKEGKISSNISATLPQLISSTSIVHDDNSSYSR